MNKKISVIIPAYNEEKFIQKTIEAYRFQNYQPLEIVVVVNNSTDRTFEVSNRYADRTLCFPGEIGVSVARNEGAKVATGEIFIFSDADSYLEQGGILKIARLKDAHIVGTFWGKGRDKDIGGKLFFFFKNLAHYLKLYEGVIDGVLFCDRDIFFKTGGFLTEREPDELRDFIKKAKSFGAVYQLIIGCYAVTSLRRYRENGYIKNIIFWIKWKILSLFGDNKKMRQEAEKYYKSIKK